MLHEERLERIVSLVEKRKRVTVQELASELATSQSTVRRSLNLLDAKGYVTKVFGGAVSKSTLFSTRDNTVSERENMNREEKIAIARYAASLIKDDDFIYLDAGTTTGFMIDYIDSRGAVFVTNSYTQAKRLSERGFMTLIPGGEVKPETEAIVGEETIESLSKYNFTKGFWGANGISLECGFTTPDLKEAIIKKMSMERAKERFVLADNSKFHFLSCATFWSFDAATIITDCVKNSTFHGKSNIIEVNKL